MYFLKKLLRKLFRRPESKIELNTTFLQKAVQLSKRGKVRVLRGSVVVMDSIVKDPSNYPYIVVFKTTKFHKPKNIEGWFNEFKTGDTND